MSELISVVVEESRLGEPLPSRPPPARSYPEHSFGVQ